jgi:putative DNA methylase
MMTMPVKTRKKLIEVALPLPEINDASAYDKMPGIGPHPKGIHHWWARLPLPTARAILFASVVDDPEAHPEKWPTEETQSDERERLFDILRRMMGKRLHEAPEVYQEARDEMLRQTGGQLPAVFDPFSGGGSIPLESYRLGFETHSADLNPVAVLLNKCNLQLAPRWRGCPPVNSSDRNRIAGTEDWRGAHGLAADIRHFGRLVRSRTEQKIGTLYPRAALNNDNGGHANVIAWVWARTVASPSPAARGKHVPLISTYWLRRNKKRGVWLEPKVNKSSGSYRFDIRTDEPDDRSNVATGTKIARGAKFRCLLTGDVIDDAHIKAEGKAGRLGYFLTAIVVEGKRQRLYLPADEAHVATALVDVPADELNEELAHDPRNIWCTGYGLARFNQLFTPRQLKSLLTLSDLVKAVTNDVYKEAAASGLPHADATEYSHTIATFLALALDRCCDFNNALCRWSPSNEKVMNLFGRQAIPMVWDFAEANILGESVGSWHTCSEYVADCVQALSADSRVLGDAHQIDAATGANGFPNLLVSTDPPYYDNISYAGLSDFFYVWLRRTIGPFYPDLFSTLLVPKIPELTASPERFNGNKEKAKDHFESGFRNAFSALRDKMDARFPLTVYYAFKQEDEETELEDQDSGSAISLTTGWETLLEALISSGFQITATWPVRASQAWRMRAMGANALASYIVLACRPRSTTAPQSDRRAFLTELKSALPGALRHLQQGNIAPVDFAQAAIGPGMAIYSRYSRILESSGKAMTVRSALSLINQMLTEVLSAQEDDFDADTRWAITWFEQHGFDDGDFGAAELLSKAKVTSVAGLQQAQIVHSRAGRVRLQRPEELSGEWDPATNKRITIWEATHQLLRLYYVKKVGDLQTADLLRKLGSRGELARDLAYRLFSICERNKRAQDAQAYNALVLGWPEISRLAREGPKPREEQSAMF